MQVMDSQLTLDEGCMMFQPPLLKSELIWDKVSDTKLLMAWNKDVIVLAFRGTASFANVFADLQVCKASNALTKSFQDAATEKSLILAEV